MMTTLPRALDLNVSTSEDIGSESLSVFLGEWHIAVSEILYNIFNVVDFILWIVVIVAEIFLICAILKFKKLQTRFNFYILVCASLNMAIHVIMFIFQMLLYLALAHMASSFICVEIRIQLTLELLYLVFTFVLSLDWFLTNAFPKMIEYYIDKWKIVFILILLCGCIEIAVESVICYKFIGKLSSHVVIFTVFLLNFCFVTFLNIFKNKFMANQKSSYVLTVLNIIVYSYTIKELYLIAHIFQYKHRFIFLLIYYIEFIPYMIAIYHPILIVYFLGKRDKYFKMAYLKLLKRINKNYTDDGLDQDFEEISNLETEDDIDNNMVQQI